MAQHEYLYQPLRAWLVRATLFSCMVTLLGVCLAPHGVSARESLADALQSEEDANLDLNSPPPRSIIEPEIPNPWTLVTQLETVLREQPVDQTRLENLRGTLNSTFLDLGVKTVETIPLHLANVARSLIQEGEHQLAAAYLDEAERLNEKLPVVAHVRAENALARGDYFGYIGKYLAAANLQRSTFWGQYFFTGNMLVLVSKAVVTFFVLFMLFLLLRELNVVSYDLTRFIPGEFNQAGMYVLGVMIIFLPVLAGWGILVAALIWGVLVWSYTSLAERGIILASLAAMLAVPTLLNNAAKNYAIYEDFDIHVALHGLKGGWNEEMADRLREIVEARPSNHEAAFYLGLLHKQHGTLDNLLKAQGYFDQAARSSRNFAPAHVGLGNVYYHTGRPELARVAFENAVNADSDAASAHYNLSRLYNNLLQFDAGNSSFQQATAIDQELIARHQEEIFRENHWNRETIDLVPTLAEIEDDLKSKLNSMRIDQPGAWNAALMGVSLGSLQALIVVFAVLMVASEFARKQFYPAASRCAMSGVPFVPSEENKGPYCEQTLNLFFKGDEVDMEARTRWKRYIQRKESAMRAFSYVATVFAPGGGHAMNEKPILGAALLLCWTLTVVGLIFNGFMLVEPLVPYTASYAFEYMSFAALALVLYAGSVATMIGEV